MTGGDQSRLMAELWETPAFRAIHQVFHLNGICIAGTSAGAAVMSRQMIAQGQAPIITQKDVVSFDIGLGLVSMAIIDQHFSQRRRLTRLLSALAQRPDLLGVGIDENTGLVITVNESIEVIGDGSVTILDGREMISNYEEIEAQEKLELLGVKMHLLPSGSSYSVNAYRAEEKRVASLLNAIKYLVLPGPARI
jgi:cyanophycinase